ncbi:MAG: hypothetical protein C5B54_06585 [Acidobacteria bacterium]|nr:MAG: hypothetical protein C5B54_06585 [Acidobacteriota bacterium]
MNNVASKDLEVLQKLWLDAWPQALAAWSKFTRLKSPTLCLSLNEARNEGLTDSFAMIRLVDQTVVINLEEIVQFHLEDLPVEVLAHEIGHHVFAPANLNDHTRMIARIRRALPTIEHQAPMVSNLYTDLLINDRLQRSANLRLGEIYRRLGGNGSKGAVWALYTRMYEILWKLERGSLGGGKTDDRMEGDAWLGARVIRSYSREWLNGSGRFATLLLPYLLEDQKSAEILKRFFDTKDAAAGGDPSGLVDVDSEELNGAVHPSEDPDLSEEEGLKETPKEGSNSRPTDVLQNLPPGGQSREPYEYGEILRAAGIQLSDHDLAVRYYRERALPYLIPFPSKHVPESKDPLMEGLEPWDIGHPLDDADWIQTVLQAPKVIPGMTTVQRVWGTNEGSNPETIPLDLDLYVDCSGSMPNPQQHTSYPALAGAILCLSALRVGARIHVVLWSGKDQVTQSNGFVRNEEEILKVLTGYYGDGTTFPIPVLRKTYQDWPSKARPVHLLMISDDGITTMFDSDEQGNSGWKVSENALRQAGGGGTFVLNYHGKNQILDRAQNEQGWKIYRISKWEELIDFAQEFSKLQWTL